MAVKSKLVPLLVSTEFRGVFFGWGIVTTTREIRLVNAQQCTYWSADVKGFLGLASTGPSKDCKIGLAVPAITLQSVTSIVECTPEAVAAWEAKPWK